MISILDIDDNEDGLEDFYFQMNREYHKFVSNTNKRIVDMTIEQCNTYIKKLPSKPIEISKEDYKKKFINDAKWFATSFLFQTPYIPIIENDKVLNEKKRIIRHEIFLEWNPNNAVLKYCESLNKAFENL